MISINASLLAADISNIEKVVKELETSGIDGLHIDIMDGRYVKNFAFGPQIINNLKKLTDLTIETHLEIKKPYDFVDLFAEG